MSPIPLTVERDSYFSLIFSSPSQSLSLSLSFVFLFFSLVSSISSCLFCGSFKGEGRILLSSAWHKIPQQRECHDEGFSHVAHNEVRVSQYILLGVVSLYFKPRSKLCSFHFQRAWMVSWGALRSRGGESSHSFCRHEERPGCGHVCMPAFATQLPWGATGHEICTAQKSPELSDNIYTTRLFITMGFSVASAHWLVEAKEASVIIHLIFKYLIRLYCIKTSCGFKCDSHGISGP